MELELARVLNVLAHEIRTPLAVSQGYVKLMAEGRFTTTTEQATVLERTREALGKIATLCSDMGRLGALAEAAPLGLLARVDAASVVDAVSDALVRHAPARTGIAAPPGLIATDGAADLAVAVAALGALACADAGPEHRVMTVSEVTDTSMTLCVGSSSAVSALPPHADAFDAAAPMLVRGGFGLSLFLAVAVLERHGVRAWQHRDGDAAIGVTFPLVTR